MNPMRTAAVLLALLFFSPAFLFGDDVAPGPPQDLNFEGQLIPWSHELLRVPEVWPVSRGSGVHVVVLDSGVDYLHPDLASSYAGGVDLLYEVDPIDTDSHGTGIAGVIAAADNAFGVVGIAPDVRIWSVKIFRLPTQGEQLDPPVFEGNDIFLAGVEWVAAKKKELGGNWIINISFGDFQPGNEAAVLRAAEEEILLVAAAGNKVDGVTGLFYPAAYESVLGVGAVDRRGNLASFAVEGAHVSVVAPGVNVPGTMTRDQGFFSSVETGDDHFFGNAVLGRFIEQLSHSGTLVDCGRGRDGECGTQQGPFIAYIRHDPDMTFNLQGRNVLSQGATGMLFVNSEGAPFPDWSFQDPDDPESNTRRWPLAIGLDYGDGAEMLRYVGESIDLELAFGDYGLLFGTSFASPHVAAVAALLWSIAPDATPEDVRDAITSTARDLGEPGRDDAYGHGIVDALAAAQKLAPHRFLTTPKKVRSRRN